MSDVATVARPAATTSLVPTAPTSFADSGAAIMRDTASGKSRTPDSRAL